MRLKEALEKKKFDVRLQDKHLNEQKISPQELESFIADLADDEQNATTVRPPGKNRSTQ